MLTRPKGDGLCVGINFSCSGSQIPAAKKKKKCTGGGDGSIRYLGRSLRYPIRLPVKTLCICEREGPGSGVCANKSVVVVGWKENSVQNLPPKTIKHGISGNFVREVTQFTGYRILGLRATLLSDAHVNRRIFAEKVQFTLT